TTELDDALQVKNSGTFDVRSGTVSAKGVFTHDAGVIDGAGTLRIEKQLLWTGGKMQGTGVTYVTAGKQLDIDDAFKDKELRASKLKNAGTVTWKDGDVKVNAGATIDNEATGIIRIQADKRLQVTELSADPPLPNRGPTQNSSELTTELDDAL